MAKKKINTTMTKVKIFGLMLAAGSQFAIISALSGTVMAKDDDEPKPPKTCTFVDKKGGAQAQTKKENWDKERGYFLKFVDEVSNVYVKQAKVDKEYRESDWWEQQRKLEKEIRFKEKLSTFGAAFDPVDDYKAALEKEENKSVYWTYLMSLGAAKGYVTGWIKEFPNSIDYQINLTKGWDNGGNSRAASIKNETLKKLEIAKTKLLALNKLINTYACPSARDNNTTAWSSTIVDKAYDIWNAADDMQTANFKKVDDMPTATPAYLKQRLVWSPEKRAWEECMNRTRHAAFPGRVDPQMQRSICGAHPTRVYVPE